MCRGGKERTSLDGTTNYTTNTGTDTRRKDNEGQRELLVVGFVDIGNKTQSHTTTSSRDTTLEYG